MIFKKYSLITGAGGLLGKYHALALLELGQNLILTDKNLNQLIPLHKELKNKFNNPQILLYKLDVTKISSIRNLNTKLIKKRIIIDVLVNNAVIDPKFENLTGNKDRFENFSIEKWNKELNVGLTGAMLCSKFFGENMVKHKTKGIILNVASDLSIISPNQNIYKVKNLPNKKQPVKPVTYSVIKHGLLGLTKYIATYWPEYIRCNAISPGSVLQNQPKKLVKKLIKLIPLNRLAKEYEYISAIKFLCSEQSSYMTGQNLIIDGGRSIW